MLVFQNRLFIHLRYLFARQKSELNERDFSFKKCYVTINVHDLFLIKLRNLQRDLRDFFYAGHFLRLK